jgi:hypothetical protein
LGQEVVVERKAACGATRHHEGLSTPPPPSPSHGNTTYCMYRLYP